MQFIHYYLL